MKIIINKNTLAIKFLSDQSIVDNIKKLLSDFNEEKPPGVYFISLNILIGLT